MHSTFGTELPRIETMRFSDKLNRVCEMRRLTNQRELADLARVSKSSLNRWLAGTSYPDVREAYRLAKVLEVPLDWLADETSDEELPETDGLTDDEQAVLDLYHALEVDRREAMRRLAMPAQISAEAPRKPEAWNPGAVRDQTQGEVNRQRQRDKPTPTKRPTRKDSDKDGGTVAGKKK